MFPLLSLYMYGALAAKFVYIIEGQAQVSRTEIMNGNMFHLKRHYISQICKNSFLMFIGNAITISFLFFIFEINLINFGSLDLIDREMQCLLMTNALFFWISSSMETAFLLKSTACSFG